MIGISSTDVKRENSETVRSCNRRKGRQDHNVYFGITVKAVNQEPGTKSGLRRVEKPIGLQKMSFLPSHRSLMLHVILCNRPFDLSVQHWSFLPKSVCMF